MSRQLVVAPVTFLDSRQPLASRPEMSVAASCDGCWLLAASEPITRHCHSSFFNSSMVLVTRHDARADKTSGQAAHWLSFVICELRGHGGSLVRRSSASTAMPSYSYSTTIQNIGRNGTPPHRPLLHPLQALADGGCLVPAESKGSFPHCRTRDRGWCS